MLLRIVPYQAVTLFDSIPRDILACKSHMEAARKIGTVLSATPLGDAVVTRILAP